VGVLSFNLGIMGKIVGGVMVGNAFFNIYVLCKVIREIRHYNIMWGLQAMLTRAPWLQYPEYQKYRPTTAEEEAAGYLQRNPQVGQ
jgi:hypothetical protein